MSFKSRALSTAALATLAAGTASADVTAEEVWTNMLAPARAFGMEVMTDPIREGRRLVVSELALRYTLPMGIGDVRFTTNGLELEEQGDGTVLVTYPVPLTYNIAVSTTAEGEVFSADLEFTGMAGGVLALGEPGLVTYRYDYDQLRIRVADVAIKGKPEFQLYIEGTFSGNGRQTITEGDIVTVAVEGENDETAFRMLMTDATGTSSESFQTVTGMDSGFTLAIPANQVDLMNLASALRAGLAFTATGTGGVIEGKATSVTGDVTVRQDTTYKIDDTQMSLNQDGFSLGGVYSDFGLDMVMEPTVPFPLSFTMARAEAQIEMPINQTEGPSPFEVMAAYRDLEMTEQIWALFDPEGQLPRDPMTLVLDISGTATLFRDTLDIARMMAVDLSTEPLGELQALTLNRLQLSAAGADLTGQGVFTFDNDDLETFPGFPAPSGTIDMRLSGGNTLLDTLVAIGLLPEDQAMAARMTMGMFGSPGEGEDELVSTIEVTGDGQVLANGQRLR